MNLHIADLLWTHAPVIYQRSIGPLTRNITSIAPISRLIVKFQRNFAQDSSTEYVYFILVSLQILETLAAFLIEQFFHPRLLDMTEMISPTRR